MKVTTTRLSRDGFRCARLLATTCVWIAEFLSSHQQGTEDPWAWSLSYEAGDHGHAANVRLRLLRATACGSETGEKAPTPCAVASARCLPAQWSGRRRDPGLSCDLQVFRQMTGWLNDTCNSFLSQSSRSVRAKDHLPVPRPATSRHIQERSRPARRRPARPRESVSSGHDGPSSSP